MACNILTIIISLSNTGISSDDADCYVLCSQFKTNRANHVIM